MEWENYVEQYMEKAIDFGYSSETIESNLFYAEKLFKQNLPIIYDGYHLGLLTGIKYEYIYKTANAPKRMYRKFQIPKKNGGIRTINEPLPNLKIVQKWILVEILEKVKISAYAKAYKKRSSIRDNVRFHKNQEKVLRLDIKDFFINIKQRKILSIFLSLGYNMEVSVLLSKLCTLNGSLPQGAPTSAYLSNIMMKSLDDELSKYCTENKIRYTRYADDMTFSGSFKEWKLIKKVKRTLKWNKMVLNKDKIHLMRQHNRQLVTGVIVNEKLQVRKSVRKDLRKQIYYIEKWGLEDHMKFIGVNTPKDIYLKSLSGKVAYCLFINPKDIEFQRYYKLLQDIANESNNENS